MASTRAVRLLTFFLFAANFHVAHLKRAKHGVLADATGKLLVLSANGAIIASSVDSPEHELHRKLHLRRASNKVNTSKLSLEKVLDVLPLSNLRGVKYGEKAAKRKSSSAMERETREESPPRRAKADWQPLPVAEGTLNTDTKDLQGKSSKMMDSTKPETSEMQGEHRDRKDERFQLEPFANTTKFTSSTESDVKRALEPKSSLGEATSVTAEEMASYKQQASYRGKSNIYVSQNLTRHNFGKEEERKQENQEGEGQNGLGEEQALNDDDNDDSEDNGVENGNNGDNVKAKIYDSAYDNLDYDNGIEKRGNDDNSSNINGGTDDDSVDNSPQKVSDDDSNTNNDEHHEDLPKKKSNDKTSNKPIYEIENDEYLEYLAEDENNGRYLFTSDDWEYQFTSDGSLQEASNISSIGDSREDLLDIHHLKQDFFNVELDFSEVNDPDGVLEELELEEQRKREQGRPKSSGRLSNRVRSRQIARQGEKSLPAEQVGEAAARSGTVVHDSSGLQIYPVDPNLAPSRILGPIQLDSPGQSPPGDVFNGRSFPEFRNQQRAQSGRGRFRQPNVERRGSGRGQGFRGRRHKRPPNNPRGRHRNHRRHDDRRPGRDRPSWRGRQPSYYEIQQKALREAYGEESHNYYSAPPDEYGEHDSRHGGQRDSFAHHDGYGHGGYNDDGHGTNKYRNNDGGHYDHDDGYGRKNYPDHDDGYGRKNYPDHDDGYGRKNYPDHDDGYGRKNYRDDNDGYGRKNYHDDGYGNSAGSYRGDHKRRNRYRNNRKRPTLKSYSYKPIKKKKKYKPVYVPVAITKKKKKKMKIISVYKGFRIAGGRQVAKAVKSLKQCMKLCAATPTCFSGDYNKWTYRCYMHDNNNACNDLEAHPKVIHFQKVPCELDNLDNAEVNLGMQAFGGIIQKGIKSLTACLKHCEKIGGRNEALADRDCFGIDYDFATHKCYIFTDMTDVCPDPLVANPSVVNIRYCT